MELGFRWCVGQWWRRQGSVHVARKLTDEPRHKKKPLWPTRNDTQNRIVGKLLQQSIKALSLWHLSPERGRWKANRSVEWDFWRGARLTENRNKMLPTCSTVTLHSIWSMGNRRQKKTKKTVQPSKVAGWQRNMRWSCVFNSWRIVTSILNKKKLGKLGHKVGEIAMDLISRIDLNRIDIRFSIRQ